MELTWKEFSDPVRRALSDLDRCDMKLLAFEANERSVTHKLAEHFRRYLDPLFGQAPGQPGKFSIDCEYNRFGTEGDTKQLPWREEVPVEAGGTYYTPNPDIIVHERGEQPSNMLVIEVKMYYNCYPTAVLIDKMKLVGYLRSPTHYQNGLYLNLGLANGHVVLTEALLAERSQIEKPDTGAMSHFWEEGKKLLLKPDAETKRPGFITPNADLHKAAEGLTPEFERAFGLTSVLDDLRW